MESNSTNEMAAESKVLVEGQSSIQTETDSLKADENAMATAHHDPNDPSHPDHPHHHHHSSALSAASQAHSAVDRVMPHHRGLDN